MGRVGDGEGRGEWGQDIRKCREFVMTVLRICCEFHNKRIGPINGGPLNPLC